MSAWTLLIDTAAGINVGLAHDTRPVAVRTETSSRRHVEALQPMIDGLLAAHGLGLGDLGLIGVGIGPGPFTGLRIGIATARVLGLATGVPVRGFGTLDAIALGWFAGDHAPGDEVVVVTDARRKEVYWASFDASGRRTGGPAVCAPGDVPILPTGGPGVELYPQVFAGRVPAGAPTGLDAARAAAHLAELPDVGLEPAYLRKPDAEAPKTRKSTLATGRLRLPSQRIPGQQSPRQQSPRQQEAR